MLLTAVPAGTKRHKARGNYGDRLGSHAQGAKPDRTAIGQGVPNALAHPDLTFNQASQIHRIVEKGAQDFDRIMIEMNWHILNDRLYVAADRLRAIWTALLTSAETTMRAMQKLEPIEFRDDED